MNSCNSTFKYNGYLYEFRNETLSFQNARVECRNSSRSVSFDLISDVTEALLDKLQEICPGRNGEYWLGLTRNTTRCPTQNNTNNFMWIGSRTCVNLRNEFPNYHRNEKKGCKVALDLSQKKFSIARRNLEKRPFICQSLSRYDTTINETPLPTSSGSKIPGSSGPLPTTSEQLSSVEVKIGGGVAVVAAFFLITFLIHCFWRKKRQNKANKLKNLSELVNTDPKKIQKQINEHLKRIDRRCSNEETREVFPSDVITVASRHYVNLSFHELPKLDIEKNEIYENVSNCSSGDNKDEKKNRLYENLTRNSSCSVEDEKAYQNIPQTLREKIDETRYENCCDGITDAKLDRANSVSEYELVGFCLHINESENNQTTAKPNEYT